MTKTDRKIPEVKDGEVAEGRSGRETAHKRWNLRTRGGWRRGKQGLLKWSNLKIYIGV